MVSIVTVARCCPGNLSEISYINALNASWATLCAGHTSWQRGMNENTHIAVSANYHKKKRGQMKSPVEEVESCLVKWRALLGHSFPEVTNEIVMRFTLAHCRLIQTWRRDVVCVRVCVCWLSLTSGIQLSSWFGFDPTFSAFVLFLPSFVHCSFHLNPIIIFSLLFLLPVYSCAFFSSFRLSFSTHVPVAPSSVWRCGRKLSRIASELWTTDFNFRCL